MRKSFTNVSRSLSQTRRRNIDSVNIQHQPTIGTNLSDCLPTIFDPWIIANYMKWSKFSSLLTCMIPKRWQMIHPASQSISYLWFILNFSCRKLQTINKCQRPTWQLHAHYELFPDRLDLCIVHNHFLTTIVQRM